MIKRKKRLSNCLFLRTDSILCTRVRIKRIPGTNELKKLCDSIRRYGMINPITVRPHGKNYELIAGEMRLIAARMLDFEYVPCLVVDVPAPVAAEMAFAENEARRETDVFERSDNILHLSRNFALTSADIFARFGIPPSTVTSLLSVQRLGRAERMLLREKPIPGNDILGAARSAPEKGQILKTAENPVPVRGYSPVVKDIRFFENSVDKILCGMRDSGFCAESTKTENADEIIWSVRIRKPA